MAGVVACGHRVVCGGAITRIVGEVPALIVAVGICEAVAAAFVVFAVVLTFGSAVIECFEQIGRLSEVSIRRIGLPDAFCEHASRLEQLKDCGLDPKGIATPAREFLAQRVPHSVK